MGKLWVEGNILCNLDERVCAPGKGLSHDKGCSWQCLLWLCPFFRFQL
jgi:hypothetical protein